MHNNYLKFFLSVIAIIALFALKANAQYYDSDDEVRFYVSEQCLSNPGKAPNAFIFNFNGSKAAFITTHSRTYTSILEDEHFFEKEIYRDKNKKILKLLDSSDGKTRYGYFGYTAYNLWIFSNEGNDMEEVTAGNHEGNKNNRRYKRVSKEKFIELALKYANASSQSETWR